MYAEAWNHCALDLDPSYGEHACPRSGLPVPFRLDHRQLLAAAYQYAKTLDAVRDPMFLGLGIDIDDPARDCPACARSSRQELNDGGCAAFCLVCC